MSVGTRNRLGLLRVDARRLVSFGFKLPSLIVIGAQRSGTSALYKQLGIHPQLQPSIRKEVQYFTRYYDRGLNWYRANFGARWTDRISFEATPDYLFDPRAPGRALETFQERDVRFIALLRHPIDRAISHFQHMKRIGLETRGIDEALLDDRSTLPISVIDDDSLRDVLRYSYVNRGFYDQQLSLWFAAFPRDRFLVIQSERFFRETDTVLEEICRFAGVEAMALASADLGPTAAKVDMSPDSRARIGELLGPVIPALHAMAIDMDWEI